MDWKSLTQKTKDIVKKTEPLLSKTKDIVKKGKPILEKATPLIDKTKDIGNNAVAFLGKQLEQTSMFLSSEEEYADFISGKRCIFVAYDGNTDAGHIVRSLMPFWKTQAWTDAADIRYLETGANEELASILNIVHPVEMRVFYMGEETFSFTDIELIREWWKKRDYIPGDTNETNANQPKNLNIIVDPLAAATKKTRSPRKKKDNTAL